MKTHKKTHGIKIQKLSCISVNNLFSKLMKKHHIGSAVPSYANRLYTSLKFPPASSKDTSKIICANLRFIR